jgi:hypothetical protein
MDSVRLAVSTQISLVAEMRTALVLHGQDFRADLLHLLQPEVVQM